MPSVIEPLLSPQKAGLIGFAALPLINPRPSHHLSDVRLFIHDIHPYQSYDALVINGPPVYPTRWSAWQDVEVGSGLILIPLVKGPLPSLQKGGLMESTVLPLISSGSFHYLSDVGLFIRDTKLSCRPRSLCRSHFGHAYYLGACCCVSVIGRTIAFGIGDKHEST